MHGAKALGLSGLFRGGHWLLLLIVKVCSANPVIIVKTASSERFAETDPGHN